MCSPLDDQYDAAARETQALLKPLETSADVRRVDLNDEHRAMVAALLLHAARCPHLVKIPAQPTTVLVGLEVVADCVDCMRCRQGVRITNCPMCGAADAGPFTEVVIQVAHVSLVMLGCGSCLDVRDLQPATCEDSKGNRLRRL